jgi:hypothetical protein
VILAASRKLTFFIVKSLKNNLKKFAYANFFALGYIKTWKTSLQKRDIGADLLCQ